MKFKTVEGLTQADVAYEIYGKDLQGLFSNAGLAVTDAMADLSKIEAKEIVEFEIVEKDVEKMLFEFLDNVVYYKDAESLIFSEINVKIKKENENYVLHAELKGEKIDNEKHNMKVDVKAVTYHHFKLEETDDGWKALVIFDV